MTGRDTVVTASMSAEAGRIVARLTGQMRDGSWFAAVCEPLEDGEIAEAQTYLDGLGLGDRAIDRVHDWQSAKAIADSTDWDRTWWSTEQDLQAGLYALAAERYGEVGLLDALTRVTDAAASLLHGPAAVASVRAGVADQGLARAAAGAAAQSCYQLGLARLAGEAPDHPFEAKFRLFLAGRWPLTISKTTFHLF